MSRSSSLRARDAFPDGEASAVAGGSVAHRDANRWASPTPETASPLAGLDAAGRIAVLARRSRPRRAGHRREPASQRAGRKKFAKQLWAQHRRVLKTVIGLLVVVAAGWLPVRALLERPAPKPSSTRG
jgi:hypothetical protein